MAGPTEKLLNRILCDSAGRILCSPKTSQLQWLTCRQPLGNGHKAVSVSPWGSIFHLHRSASFSCATFSHHVRDSYSMQRLCPGFGTNGGNQNALLLHFGQTSASCGVSFHSLVPKAAKTEGSAGVGNRLFAEGEGDNAEVSDSDSEDEGEWDELVEDEENSKDASSTVSSEVKEGTFVRQFPRLSGRDKKELRAYAHSMGKAIVLQQIGKWGLTKNVLKCLDDALEGNELIKVRISDNCGAEVSDVTVELEQAIQAQTVGKIGRTILIYRPSLSKVKASTAQAEAMKKKQKPRYDFGASDRGRGKPSGPAGRRSSSSQSGEGGRRYESAGRGPRDGSGSGQRRQERSWSTSR